ncbi:MAG: TonB family protein [Oligoflexales bacterium]|nr:TonB family protein [Oligoflexales bacterium]
MGNKNIDTPEAAKLEGKILRWILLISLVLHVAGFFLNPSKWWDRTPPRLEEWAIEADISGLELPKGKEHKPAKSEQKEKDTRRMLPQLPKKYAVKEKQEQTQNSDDKIIPEEKEGDKPDKKTEEDLAASKAKPEDDATKLFKEELIKRLKKEQERQEKLAQEKEKKEKQKIDSIIAKRKGELAGESSAHKGSKVTKNHPYIVAVTEKIRRTYSLPGVYRIETGQMPILVIVIGKSGKIEELTLSQSSNNVAMDKLALKTVQDAAPFPRPPREILGKPIRFRFDPSPM